MSMSAYSTSRSRSSLYTGERRHKTDNVFQTLGHIDELNSLTGLARHYSIVEDNGLGEVLLQVQCCLQELMSHVATPPPLQADDDEPDEEKVPSPLPSLLPPVPVTSYV